MIEPTDTQWSILLQLQQRICNNELVPEDELRQGVFLALFQIACALDGLYHDGIKTYGS